MADRTTALLFHRPFQVVLIAIIGQAVLAQSSENNTELCHPFQLPCGDNNCRLLSREDDSVGTPAICTCPSTGLNAVKYCHIRRPTWDQREEYKQCKWSNGGPDANNPRLDTLVTPLGCDLGIYVICPQRGPIAGGTDIVIWGHGFAEKSSDMEVGFQGFICKIIYSNSTFIHCQSASAEGTNVIGSFLRLEIKLVRTGCRLEERSAFTYWRNPTITHMEPVRSILGGGTMVTFKGTNFDSVVNVLMQITSLYQGDGYLSVSECRKLNNTAVICPAPMVSLPQAALDAASNVTDAAARRRRQVAPLWGGGHFQRRRRRSVGLMAVPRLNVYAGLKMDGVTQGELYTTWQIYKNPIVEEFPGEFHNYRPAWPDYDEFIYVYGRLILSGVTPEDYSVTIGSQPCEHLVFTMTSIRCKPPVQPPLPPPGALQRDGDPAMMIKVGNLVYVAGYVHYDLDSWNNSKVRYAVIGVLSAVIPIITCLVILIAVRCYYRRKQKKQKAYNDDDLDFPIKSMSGFSESPKNDYVVGDYLHPKASLLQAVSPELRAHVQACLIHAGRIDKTHIKVRGDAGAIYRGWLLDEKGSRMMSADIKTFKHDNVVFRDLRVFLQDAVKLHGYTHDNVQRLLAITVRENIPQAVYPSCEYGDLKSFLYKQRQRQQGMQEVEEDTDRFLFPHPDIQELTSELMVKLGADITAGMTYLSDKGFIHEDLAARNCVLDKDMVVKVADAALSCDIYELDYWRPGEKLELRPVKWMAPESLDTNFFSVKSDVWSFGVTLWEIFTLGMTPYTDVTNADMRDHLKQGHRLSKPDKMPVSLYTEVTHCWAKEPNKRPHFEALNTFLKNFGTSSAGGAMNKAFSTSGNPVINDVDLGGARPSTTSAELISVYIEEGTRQRNSLNSKRDSADADKVVRDSDEIRRDSMGSEASAVVSDREDGVSNPVTRDTNESINDDGEVSSYDEVHIETGSRDKLSDGYHDTLF